MSIEWGIRDTKDGTWLGNEYGPFKFLDEDLAKTAARVADVRLEQPAGRTRAEVFANKPVRLKETVVPRLSGVEALDRLEQDLTL